MKKILHNKLLILPFTVLLFLVSCEAGPKDPEDSLNKAKERGFLRVGLIESPPWVVRSSNSPAGIEPGLIQGFAKSNGLKVKWFWGNPQSHMEALENFELDLVAGGFTSANPWKKHVGFTIPYYTSKIVIGVPDSWPDFSSLQDLDVVVRTGDGLSKPVKKKGANPVMVEEFKNINRPVAAEEWEVQKLGMKNTGMEVKKSKHVLLIPPGENALLMEIEKYLLENTNTEEIKNKLPEVDES